MEGLAWSPVFTCMYIKLKGRAACIFCCTIFIPFFPFFHYYNKARNREDLMEETGTDRTGRTHLVEPSVEVGLSAQAT